MTRILKALTTRTVMSDEQLSAISTIRSCKNRFSYATIAKFQKKR
jgi:hypothetical protein